MSPGPGVCCFAKLANPESPHDHLCAGPAPEPCPACNSTTPCNCSEYEVLGAIVEQHPIPSSRTPGMSLGPATKPFDQALAEATEALGVIGTGKLKDRP